MVCCKRGKLPQLQKRTVEIVSANQIVRKVHFPNAFVADYQEDYGHTEGIGEFTLVIRQKKGINLR